MTGDRTRGYAHCGDWEPLSLPDTAAHVGRVHDLGVRYLLWYALPFIGKESAAWDRLGRYALADAAHMGAVVADPGTRPSASTSPTGWPEPSRSGGWTG